MPVAESNTASETALHVPTVFCVSHGESSVSDVFLLHCFGFRYTTPTVSFHFLCRRTSTGPCDSTVVCRNNRPLAHTNVEENTSVRKKGHICCVLRLANSCNDSFPIARVRFHVCVQCALLRGVARLVNTQGDINAPRHCHLHCSFRIFFVGSRFPKQETKKCHRRRLCRGLENLTRRGH